MTENERVREIRKHPDIHMTMEQFGARLGVGKTAISGIENGARGVTDQMARSICREFHVSETWLRTGEGEMFLPMNDENRLNDWATQILSGDNAGFRQRFVNMLMNLSDEGWLMLEQKVRELAGVDIAAPAASVPPAAPSGSVVSSLPIDSNSVEAAEAAYIEASGIAPSMASSVSSTTAAGSAEKAV